MVTSRVDVHQHLIPAFHRAALNAAGIGAAGGRALPDWSPEAALAHMGILQISTAILSVSTPGAGFLRDAGQRASMARKLKTTRRSWRQVRLAGSATLRRCRCRTLPRRRPRRHARWTPVLTAS